MNKDNKEHQQENDVSQVVYKRPYFLLTMSERGIVDALNTTVIAPLEEEAYRKGYQAGEDAE